MGHRWTPEVQETVAQYVRAGGFVWVAAEAAGLPRRVMEAWMRRGADSARQPYRGFHDAILQARAQARLKAEMETRTKNPRDWLRLGPGRERLGLPGWTNGAKAETTPPSHTFDLGEMSRVVACIKNTKGLTVDMQTHMAASLDNRFRALRRQVDWF